MSFHLLVLLTLFADLCSAVAAVAASAVVAFVAVANNLVVAVEEACSDVVGYHRMVAAYHIGMAAADLIVDMQGNCMANGYSYCWHLYQVRIAGQRMQLVLLLHCILYWLVERPLALIQSKFY